ncbi:MFS transporter [Shewanella insulae]|uniref:MFS transporter n=1 Tax=Shewanella insulae TaxID=2681496 RepID=UPI0024814D63|nr:MFS transporter [Shewanella insulae]
MRLATGSAFVIAATALILVFATAGAPISLFNSYRLDDGLSNADLGLVSLGYFFSAATALIVFGRLSNVVGRKPMALAALLCAVASCCLLLNMQHILVLFAARALQGFACGIATGSIGAYVVDTSRGRPAWLVAAITSTSPMIGISSGAIVSGALVTWAPMPRMLIFILLIAILSICLLLFLFSPESIKSRAGADGYVSALASLRPRLYFPVVRKWAFLTLACVVVATWSLGAFYQAFGPSIVAEQLGTNSPILAALAFSSVMILTPMGGYLTSGLTPRRAVLLGMLLYIGAALMILVSLDSGWLPAFLCASLLVGIAQGAATTACFNVLLAGLAVEQRAGLLSSVFVISYAGAVVPGLVASLAASSFSVFQICIGYVLLGVAAAIAATVTSFWLEAISGCGRAAEVV